MRVRCSNATEASKEVLKMHTLPGVPVEKLFGYSQLEFKRRGKWAEIYRHRSFLSDLFAATQGMLIKHQALIPLCIEACNEGKIICTADDGDKMAHTCHDVTFEISQEIRVQNS